ncbi:MAG: diaminopimelate epimerase [Coraliomargaritaceae bacterium]
MKFYKYHALGNDYLVLDPKDCPDILDDDAIIRICHRNFGLGSDGILYGPLPTEGADCALKIFNPDGSEAEKSGNGLRIFARYLHDHKLIKSNPFKVITLGGEVTIDIEDPASAITVDMGSVRFADDAQLKINDTDYLCHIADIGNPHCVIPLDSISPELTHKEGPAFETHPHFPNRTNVQFLKILDRNNIQIEIWERGAGYTLASGSSSSAAAAIAHKLGHCDEQITVHMPGGTIQIEIGENYAIKMTGPTTRVGTYELDLEALK